MRIAYWYRVRANCLAGINSQEDSSPPGQNCRANSTAVNLVLETLLLVLQAEVMWNPSDFRQTSN